MRTFTRTSSMAARGAGSKGSPIIISDDEGEVFVSQPLPQEPYSVPLDTREVKAKVGETPTAAPKGMKMMLNMGYTPGLGLGRDLDGPVEPVPLVLKRKRDEGGVGCDRHSGSPARVILERLEGAFLKPESKKARKRRRRLERETLACQPTWEHHPTPPRSALEVPQVSKFEPKPRTWPRQANSGSVSALHSWPGAGPAFNPYQFSHASDMIGGRFQRPPDSLPRVPLSQSATFDNANTSMRSAPLDPIFPVQASNVLPVQVSNVEPNIGGRLPARPPFSHGPLDPHSLDGPLLPMSQPGPSRSLVAQAPLKLPASCGSKQVASGPPGIKKVLPIGMKSHHIPNNTHGLFHRTTSTSASAPDRRPYRSNPSRTLVIEQLPKSKRNREFIWNWCKRICGKAPVNLELDTNGKALVEFENAEMARALFSSPRFQSDPERAAIRVWWYRPDGPGPAVDDGEIEEGEIEEDESNKWQPLTKKEKKAQKKVNKKREQMKQYRELIPDAQAKSRLNGGVTSKSAHFDLQPSIDSPLLPAFVSSALATYCPSPSFTGDCSPTVPSWVAEPESSFQSYPACGSPKAMASSPLATGGDDDCASIASSRHGSPLIVSSIPTKEADVDSILEDMELESPTSSQLPNRAQTDAPSSQVVTPTLPKNVKGTMTPTAPVPRPAQPHQPAPASRLNIPSFSLKPPVQGVASVSFECTPAPSSNIISEPRAMKNPPKGPSHAKRSLQARQKELEERIARSKLELSKASSGAGPNDISSESTSTGTSARSDTATLSTPTLLTEGTDPAKVAEEGHLRRLVLESKRNKALNSTANTQTIMSDTSSALSHSAETPSNLSPFTDVTFLVYSGTSNSPVPSVVSGSVNSTPAPNAFEDMAVSFITEAIQTTRPLPLKPSPAMMKLELAAKQRWLEQQIAESKLLMAKLNLAQTKQEKDVILRVMRERSRLTESEMKPSAVSTENHHLDRSILQATDIPSRVRWPETTEDAGIFIVSDDEEEL